MQKTIIIVFLITLFSCHQAQDTSIEALKDPIWTLEMINDEEQVIHTTEIIDLEQSLELPGLEWDCSVYSKEEEGYLGAVVTCLRDQGIVVLPAICIDPEFAYQMVLGGVGKDEIYILRVRCQQKS